MDAAQTWAAAQGRKKKLDKMVDDLFEGDDKDLQDAVKWVRYYLDRGKSVALSIATSF
jgi:hypothetical protein